MMSQGEDHLVVAIDGPAGSGKSTAARLVAERLGYTLLDSGAIYRAVALVAGERGVSLDDGEALAALAGELPIAFVMRDGVNRVLIGERDVSLEIRTPEASSGASRVSAHPPVRAALMELQRRFAARGPVVAEGRDMGTVVFPTARLKVFLSADPRERARRRYLELQERGVETTLEEVLDDQVARDKQDSEREVAPLTPAEDAVKLDSTGMTLEQVVEKIVELVKEENGK